MKILVEPSGAVPAAAALYRKLPKGVERVGIVLSGGNVDFEQLANIWLIVLGMAFEALFVKLSRFHGHDNPVPRNVQFTQETLFIKRGQLRVDFFDTDRRYVCSRILHAGDVILLVQGGHGFEVLEELEMFEVKQGPYTGEEDKTRFDGKLPAELNFSSGGKNE